MAAWAVSCPSALPSTVPGLEGSPVKEEQMQGDDWSVSGILCSVLVQPLQKFAGDVTSAITSTESWKKLKCVSQGGRGA